jgi:glycosyltransferase involved in cell wall biosynthesis
MAKIVVIVRTLNERKHIERFCRGYAWADKILVADGGSEDNTIHLALQFPNVEIREYHVRAERNGLWRNPEGAHINFLIDWANEESAEWIVMDDCDSTPNYTLQLAARQIFEGCASDSMWMLRMYLYGTDKWFNTLTGTTVPPQKTLNGRPVDWYGLWGWRADVGLRWWEGDPWTMTLIEPNVIKAGTITKCRIDYPSCLLHYFCLDDEETLRKWTFYKQTTGNHRMQHPLEANGPLELLPEWAHP